jgi:uncharacterized protein YjeT (DUF2065 family)
MWRDLGMALALLLVLEGIMPFINPGFLRRMLVKVLEASDAQLRFAGLTSMLLGLILLYILRWSLAA